MKKKGGSKIHTLFLQNKEKEEKKKPPLGK